MPPAEPPEPLKPDVDASLLLDDDADEATIRLAENVDRLAADFDLVTTLALHGFKGLQYTEFEEELAKYGISVITSWVRRGTIRYRCLKRGYGNLPSPPLGAFDDENLVADLVNETVGHALIYFRDVLVEGRWDYRKGAALRTYFIGQCLLQFSNVYTQWVRHDVPKASTIVNSELIEYGDLRPVPNIDQLVLDQMAGTQLLGQMKRRDQTIFQLWVDGWKQAEIAAELGITTKTVERAVANARTRLRKERGA